MLQAMFSLSVTVSSLTYTTPYSAQGAMVLLSEIFGATSSKVLERLRTRIGQRDATPNHRRLPQEALSTDIPLLLDRQSLSFVGLLLFHRRAQIVSSLVLEDSFVGQ